jgi:hypothetical protein
MNRDNDEISRIQEEVEDILDAEGSSSDHDEEKPGHKEAEDDVFNLKRLRLTQNFAEEISVKKAITTVPVRKPNSQEFFYVRFGEDWRLQTCVVNFKEDHGVYLVDPQLWPGLSAEIIPTVLLTCINRQGVLFLWSVRLPKGDGRHDHWSRSALEAAEMAQSGWVRMVANMSLGAYEIYQANGDIPDPEWPDISFERIIQIAFKDNFIRDLKHIVVRRLRGLQ